MAALLWAGPGTSAEASFRDASLQALVDTQGKVLGVDPYPGKYHLVLFGFTSCADVCPLTLIAMKEAMRLLGDNAVRVVPIFISVDPERDQGENLARYVAAFERYDIDALAALLHEEATMSMPPYELWLRGRTSIARWMLTYGIGCHGSRLVPVQPANGLPAFVQYRQDGEQPWAVVLVELDGGVITSLHYFLDTKMLFPKFGMPTRYA